MSKEEGNVNILDAYFVNRITFRKFKKGNFDLKCGNIILKKKGR